MGEEGIGEPGPIGAGAPQRDLTPPAAAGGQPRGEPQRPQRPAAPRAVREQPRDQQLQRPLELLAGDGLGQLQLHRDRLSHRPRPQRLVLAAGQPQRPQSQPPEAIGHRIARQLGEPPEGGDPEPLELVGKVVGHRRRDARRAARPAADPGTSPPLRPERSAELPGGHIGAEATRAGTEPRRLPGSSARRSSTPSIPPQSPARPPASKNASPARSDSTSAPIPSSRRSASSQARSARSGSGGTRASSGQRESASPILIPGRSPNLSAASVTSPISCAAPGSGASAAGSRQGPSIADRGDQPEAGDQGACDGHRTYVRIPAAIRQEHSG